MSLVSYKDDKLSIFYKNISAMYMDRDEKDQVKGATVFLEGGGQIELTGSTAANLYKEFTDRLEEIDREIIAAEAASRGIATARFPIGQDRGILR